MLPSELTIAVVALLNLVLAMRVTRKTREAAGYTLPLVLSFVFSLAFSVTAVLDLYSPREIMSPATRMVWDLSLRLQNGLSVLIILLNYSSALNESRAYRSIKQFLNELQRLD